MWIILCRPECLLNYVNSFINTSNIRFFFPTKIEVINKHSNGVLAVTSGPCREKVCESQDFLPKKAEADMVAQSPVIIHICIR